MKINYYKIRRKVSLRYIDKVLASGTGRQLLLLLILTVSIWIGLFAIAKFAHLRSRDILSIQKASVEEVGVGDLDLSGEEEFPLWWTIYYHFIDPGSQHESSPRARWLVMLISFLGTVVMSGIFISTFSNIFERRVEGYKNGLLRYNLKGHVVIFGYNQMTSYLLKQIYNTPRYRNRTIIIHTSKPVDQARQELESKLSDEQTEEVIFYYGRRDVEIELRSLHIDKAMELFILGEGYVEDKIEYAHDSLNMDCLNIIGKLCEEKRTIGRIVCNVLFEYQTTFSAFQHSNISSQILDSVIFKPFNIHEDWARKVFIKGSTADGSVKYEHLDRGGIGVDSDKRVHLIVVGISKMGAALAMEAMRIAHFPNYKRANTATKITFIDTNADSEFKYFRSRNRALFDMINYSYEDIDSDKPVEYYAPSKEYAYLGDPFVALELEFIKGNIADQRLFNKVQFWAEQESSIVTIAVCFNMPHTSLSCALSLPEVVYSREIPVLVLQRDSSAVIHNIAGLSLTREQQIGLKYSSLRPFGMDSDSVDIISNDNLRAKSVKFVYDYYYEKKEQPNEFPSEQELNESWNKINKAHFIWANIYNADSIETKLRSVGYLNMSLTGEQLEIIADKSLPLEQVKEQLGGEVTAEQIAIVRDGGFNEDQVNFLSEVEHNRWNVDRLLIGFRPPTYIEDCDIESSKGAKKGEYKDKFVHYDIRPYDDLRNDVTGTNAKEYDICITKALLSIIKL